MENTESFESIDVAMDVVLYMGDNEDYKGKYLVLEKAEKYQENRERYKEMPWEIPGGKFEIERESYSDLEIKQEGIRELWEETKMPAVPLATGKSYEKEQEDVNITFYPIYFEFAGNPEFIELDPEEHKKYEWIDVNEFYERMTNNETKALNRVKPVNSDILRDTP